MSFIPHKRRVASSWITNSNENQIKVSVKQSPQTEDKMGGSLANVKKPNSDNKVQVLNNNSQAKDKIKTFINF